MKCLNYVLSLQTISRFLMKQYITVLLGLLAMTATAGTDYQLPIGFTPELAGNYGELRPNHFHAGLDFKTQQTIGHPVYAFEDGYVWRAVIYAYGYGYALYVKHPKTGQMTVYGHLDAFRKDIAQAVLDYQIEHEANNPDVYFSPADFPVKRGDEIAKSGNTGSSGGPHVHFEIRGIDNDEFYDPMPYFKDKITDTKAPRLSHFYLYPLGGLANGSSKAKQTLTANAGKGKNKGKAAFTAWGKVGIGLKAYDYMDGQANKFGVKYVRVWVDGKQIFGFAENAFFYDERRFTNSTTDYAAWKRQRSMIFKAFVEPGNKLRMIDHTLGNGILTIDKEKTYEVKIELEDCHGNKSEYAFQIKGKKGSVTEPKTKGTVVKAGETLHLVKDGMELDVPAGVFYTDLDIEVSHKPQTNAQRPCLSDIYTIGTDVMPMHDFGTLRIAVPETYDGDTAKLYLSDMTKGNLPLVSSRKMQNGRLWVEANVRDLGQFAVREDNSDPNISIVGKPVNSRIVVRITDAGSGIKSWRGEIDGKFIPFDMDNRGLYVARPKNFAIPKGNHTLTVTATDRCGNTTTFTKRLWF